MAQSFMKSLEIQAAESMRGKVRKEAMVPRAKAFEAGEYTELIILVGNAESARESDVIAEFAQDLGAEGVNRPSLDAVTVGTELFQSRRDFLGGFVGECERENSRGLELARFD